jgi:CRP-like cAMP-binding protein
MKKQGIQPPKQTKSVISSKSQKSPASPLDFFKSFFNEPRNHSYYFGEAQICPAKAVIFKMDTPSNAVYHLEQGLVKLVRVTSNGNQVIVGLRHRDWLIGAPAALLDKPYSYTAIAVVPSLLHGIPKKRFIDLVKMDAQFSWHVNQQLSQQISNHMKQVTALSYLSAGKRLELFLSDMIRELESTGNYKPDSFSLPFSNQELAQILMITPEHLCRILVEMEKKGLVQRRKGNLVVTDPTSILQKTTR